MSEQKKTKTNGNNENWNEKNTKKTEARKIVSSPYIREISLKECARCLWRVEFQKKSKFWGCKGKTKEWWISTHNWRDKFEDWIIRLTVTRSVTAVCPATARNRTVNNSNKVRKRRRNRPTAFKFLECAPGKISTEMQLATSCRPIKQSYNYMHVQIWTS